MDISLSQYLAKNVTFDGQERVDYNFALLSLEGNLEWTIWRWMVINVCEGEREMRKRTLACYVKE